MSATEWTRVAAISLVFLSVACAPKRVAAPSPPPAPKQNVFVLLPDPEGMPGGAILTNAAGAGELNQPYRAIRVERADTVPGPPFPLDRSEVKRLFGPALDVLPAPEVLFTLHYDPGRDVLNGASQAQLPAVLDAILNAIRERRSTAVTVIGHTDTTADERFNFDLGLRRAKRMAEILAAQGVDPSNLFVTSHGYRDLLAKTALDVAEARNRRVEIVVR